MQEVATAASGILKSVVFIQVIEAFRKTQKPDFRIAFNCHSLDIMCE